MNEEFITITKKEYEELFKVQLKNEFLEKRLKELLKEIAEMQNYLNKNYKK